MLGSAQERRAHYRENMRCLFGVTADLYYAHWGEFFHLAVFEDGEELADFEPALERTHQQYFAAIDGARAGRILDLATGGGAFAAWMAEHTPGEVVGVDISDAHLAHARRRLVRTPRANLRFVEYDIMRLADLDEAPFDAAVYLDAACYLPDKQAALTGIAMRQHPGARLLVVDWCRPEHVTALQTELVLEPFYRAWGIPEMETVSGYRRGLAAAGLRLLDLQDLSARVALNWERGYQIAIQALAQPATLEQLARVAASAVKYGPRAVRLAKDQFYAALFARVAADAGLLRYVYLLAERT